jgi:hypothetical protein
MLFLGDLLLRGLYAFDTEPERGGELEGGVEGEWVFNLLALHLDENSSARSGPWGRRGSRRVSTPTRVRTTQTRCIIRIVDLHNPPTTMRYDAHGRDACTP